MRHIAGIVALEVPAVVPRADLQERKLVVRVPANAVAVICGHRPCLLARVDSESCCNVVSDSEHSGVADVDLF